MADGQFLQRARSYILEPSFANLEGRTPEDVERRRLLAQELLASGRGDGRVESIPEGFANMLNAWFGAKSLQGVERENTAAAERNRALWEGLNQQAFGGALAPTGAPASSMTSPITPGAQGRTDGSWMLAGSPNAAGAPAFGDDPTAYIASLAPGLRTEGMDPVFATRLASAAADFQAETGQPATFTSLARTTEEQAELYRRYQAGEIGLAAPPGQSRHETGAAADLSGPFLAWMQQNGSRYGLAPLSGRAGEVDPGHWQLAEAGGQQAQAGDPNRQAIIAQLLGGDAQAQALGQQMIIQQLTAQPTQPDYGWQEVNGTLLRTDAQGNAVPVYTAPASSTERRTAEDTNGVLRYIDTGEPVFPNVQPAPAAPDFGNENSLRTQFNQITAPFRDTAQAYHRIETALANPSAASDVSLIFAYMRMLDPASTVREGEFATAQQTTGLPGQIVNLYNRLLTGERLNDTQRADFGLQAQGLYEASVRQYNQYADFYRSIAPQYGIDPSRVVLPLEAVPMASAPTSSFVAPPNPNDPLGLFP